MRTSLRLMTGALMALPLAAVAATPPPPTKPVSSIPKLSEILEASGITLSGAIDASWDFSDVDGGPNGAGAPISFAPTHAFDVSQNAFSLHQVNVTVARQPAEGVGFLVNVIGGDDAGIIGGKQADIDVTQGFISATNGAMTVIGGRYTTLAGYEVINPAANLNASRSLLFTLLQPLTHTGVRGTFKPGDAFGVTLGVNNSASITDYGAIGVLGLLAAPGSLKNENNTSKTVEFQVAFTPSKAFSTYLTHYRGEEDNNAVGSGTQTEELTDLVVNASFGPLTVGLNADYLAVDSPNGVDIGTMEVIGTAGYLGASFGAFRTALRGEYLNFDIPLGAANSVWVREVTLTTGLKVADNLELIGEVRHDQIDDVNGGLNLAPRDVSVAGGLNDDMFSGTIKAIYSF